LKKNWLGGARMLHPAGLNRHASTAIREHGETIPMFDIGQRVVCIDASPTYLGKPVPLRRGTVYTVAALGDEDFYGVFGVYLAEIDAGSDSKHLDAFRHTRFRPVIERKTDISVFEEMIKPVREPVMGLSGEFVL